MCVRLDVTNIKHLLEFELKIDNNIQLLGRLRKRKIKHLMLYKEHLMHPTQESSPETKRTSKRS